MGFFKGLFSKETVSQQDRLAAIEKTVEPFIEVADQPPSLRDVVRRNVVRMSVTKAANVRQPTLIIISAIDNLVKGAAGQALQNANVLLGLSEQAGLPA